jgi:tRNA A37 threonylcarbamoyladenosine synthetase subunit TsaC/SUA5/YrdC
LDDACRALADGQPVVVANPSPQTYGIVATTPRPVNVLKGRPPDQNVAVSMHDQAEWQAVAPCLDLPAEWPVKVRALLDRKIALLVPLRPAYPDWLAPAVRNGHLGMFNGCWRPLARLWDRFPRLYGSSANRTGQLPAASAAEAIDSFGTEAVVVDGDALRDLGRPHAASTMVRIDPDGELHLHRSGAQDAGLESAEFLQQFGAVGYSSADE